MSRVTDTTIAVYDMKVVDIRTVTSIGGKSPTWRQIVLAPNWERAEEGWQVVLPLDQGLNGLKEGDELKLHIEKYD